MRWLDDMTESMDMSFEQTPVVREGPGSLACCCPWDCKESDMADGLNKDSNLLC